jgi:hypothetical protein
MVVIQDIPTGDIMGITGLCSLLQARNARIKAENILPKKKGA